MPTQQCVTNAFVNNGGLLEVRDCTDGTDWPYACDEDLYQGLRTTPSGCLWAEPRPRSVTGYVESNRFFNATVTSADPQSVVMLQWEVENPDTCRSMLIHLAMVYTWEIVPLNVGSEYLFAKKLTGDFPESDTDFITLWHSQNTSLNRKYATANDRSLLVSLGPGESLSLTAEHQARSPLENLDLSLRSVRFEAAWVGVAL